MPTLQDAGGWPHFLEGGYTVVRGGDSTTGFYLINNTHELVTTGGNPMPQGSVLFELLENGSWGKVRGW
ncbi:MAG: hypothetical protein WCD89_20610 [Anaerocolumna sp.]